MYETLSHRAPLIVMTMFFAALAMNIAVPALVLAAMGLMRWVVLKGGEGPSFQGRPA
ncbi:hypothetical protein NOF55_17410 [Rhizobiaceae bacterium BDR2-2]|uniref:Uncharacterized protein n=1 Tax=Ectorhizobium quercum TaxID=2965071 RepID=A0AAE3N295_9HYPH|nr:hypothetical protein [Ectorhizobium quercum]MCX8998891.1 hypothetical protein [Ectorhizobium quercum]